MTETTEQTLPPLQDGFCLTVMSNDTPEAKCPGCGEKRVIFQADYFAFPGKPIRARCKACHVSAASQRGGVIFVKTHAAQLAFAWKNDKIQPGPKRPSRKSVE